MTWVEVPGSLPPGFAIGGDSITVDATGGAYQGLAQGETFTTHFDYDVVDEFGASVHQTATVTVTGTNDAPVANADTLAASEDTPVTYTAAQLLGNDTDVDGDTLTIASVTSGTGGTAVLNARSEERRAGKEKRHGGAAFS